MISRRKLLSDGAVALGAAGMMAAATKVGHAASVEAAVGDDYTTRPPSHQSTIDIGDTALTPGVPIDDYTPVVSPNLPSLPWKVIDGVKVFHMVAEEMWHEFAPGLRAICWGYNGHMPGPTIEAVEGDHIRIYVTNRLKTKTTIHWHGVLVPNGVDGVSGLNQRAIRPGETYKYEFTLRQHGTLMYHSHHDEMTQIGMGLNGMFIIHPRRPIGPRPARDFAILLNEWRVPAGAYRPNPNEMTDFNVLTFNGKSFPGTDALVTARGDLVRIRIGNLSHMSHHPIHIHGHSFRIVETDGGRIPESAQWPETTVLVPVGATQVIEFIADAPGDWAMHCHMTHHMMNQMGHTGPNMVGVQPGSFESRAAAMVPGFMAMGTTGMGDMGEMHMALPENTVSMMGAYGQYDYITMGGMFTILKVREGLTDFTDPGWYQHPTGTLALQATNEELKADGIDV